MQLPKKLNYLTHLPVLKAVCKTFSPNGILELGCGKHSTSFFYNYDGNVVSLENDKKWCDSIRNICPDNDKFKLIYHDLGDGVSKRTTHNELSEKNINDVNKFYDNILHQYDLNFLFVDHWKSIRYRSIRYLADKFDIIAYHDAEDRKKGYKYRGLISEPIDGFFHWIYCSFTTYTGILINKKYNDKLEIFDKNMRYYHEKFCESINKKCKYKIKRVINAKN